MENRYIYSDTIVCTSRIKELIADNLFLEFVQDCLHRHMYGDWGDLYPGDWKLNDLACSEKEPGRLLSSYNCYITNYDIEKIWIITEWDRSYTTILLPEEY